MDSGDRAHLTVGLDAGPQLAGEVTPVPVALAPPNLDADVVQPKALPHERLDLPLVLRGQLKNERRQGCKDLSRWKVPVKEVLQLPQAVFICVLNYGPCLQQEEWGMRSDEVMIRAADLVLPTMADAHVFHGTPPETA